MDLPEAKAALVAAVRRTNQRTVALEIGVGEATISRWMADEPVGPSRRKLLIQWASALPVDSTPLAYDRPYNDAVAATVREESATYGAGRDHAYWAGRWAQATLHLRRLADDHEALVAEMRNWPRTDAAYRAPSSTPPLTKEDHDA